jgi:hypothetical protein
MLVLLNILETVLNLKIFLFIFLQLLQTPVR